MMPENTGYTGYEIAPWARVRQEDFGLLFYDTRTTNLTYVRSGGALVVSGPRMGGVLLYGRGVRGESVRRVLARLVDKGLIRQSADGVQVAHLLPPETLTCRPVVSLEKEGAAAADIPFYAEPLRAPVNITWEITSRCNLACRHCLSAELRGDRDDGLNSDTTSPDALRDLTYEECISFVDQVADFGVFQLNLGGGEPFLRDDLLDVLRYAHSRGIVTCVSTNGLLLSSEVVRELAAMELLYLQVSLDGASPGTNDAIRGAGVFAGAMRGMELLARYDMRDWSINTVVTRQNLSDIPRLCVLAKRLGAKTRLSRFRPAGNAKQVWEEYRLSPKELVTLSRYLGDHQEVLTGDSFFALTGQERQHLGLNTCGAARMTLSVAPTGDVYPCAFLCEPEFLAGSVREDTLANIFGHSQVMSRFRCLEVKACRGCERFDLCHGGCPAVAYFANQSLSEPDPECLVAAMNAWVEAGAG